MGKKLAFTVALVGLVALSAVAGAQISQRFNDVPTDHYAHDAIEWAVEIGVTAGCGDGSDFCPSQTLNRAHMVTFLKRYHDWFTSGTPSPPPDAPPKYPTYEAAAVAADEWYQEMERIIASGDDADDWNQVTQHAADKAALWAGHDETADRLANEVRILSRTAGDPLISTRLGSLGAAKFYASAAGYALAAAASDATLGSNSERDAAAAAAWSAAGARLAELGEATINNRFGLKCDDCVIGGLNGLGSARGTNWFDFSNIALMEASTARDSYFDEYS